MTFDDIHEKYREYMLRLNFFERLIRDENMNYESLQKILERMYRYLKLIAPTFYLTDQATGKGYMNSLYSILINEVKYIEQDVLPRKYFIISTEPNFIYQANEPKKTHSKMPEEILDWLVYVVRHRYASEYFFCKDTIIKYSDFENECTDICKLVDAVCKENNIPCETIRINPGFERTARLYNHCNYHDVCIIHLNGEYFLVDCSYRQFFMLKRNSFERIGIPLLSNTKPGVFMTLSRKRLEVANRVIERGWMKLTDENIKNYFDGFALSFRNGHYYDETGDYTYTTNYDASNYIEFLEGRDNQTNHEGEHVLKKQATTSHYDRKKI